MSLLLSLPRVLQLLICSYCDVITENTEFYTPVVITFYHDGLHVVDQTFRGVSSHKFVYLPDWKAVHVDVYKMNGTVVMAQNEKMQNHSPLHGNDVGVICKHSLVPLACDSERFAYQDVNKWWVAPMSHRSATFPFVLSGVNAIVVFQNALREFV